jgi:hypothetical protein
MMLMMNILKMMKLVRIRIRMVWKVNLYKKNEMLIKKECINLSKNRFMKNQIPSHRYHCLFLFSKTSSVTLSRMHHRWSFRDNILLEFLTHTLLLILLSSNESYILSNSA